MDDLRESVSEYDADQARLRRREARASFQIKDATKLPVMRGSMQLNNVLHFQESLNLTFLLGKNLNTLLILDLDKDCAYVCVWLLWPTHVQISNLALNLKKCFKNAKHFPGKIKIFAVCMRAVFVLTVIFTCHLPWSATCCSFNWKTWNWDILFPVESLSAQTNAHILIYDFILTLTELLRAEHL